MDKRWLISLDKGTLRCYLCGCLIETRKDLSKDHVVPKCKGGYEKRPAHLWCNLAKGQSKSLTSEGLLNIIERWHHNGTFFTPKVWQSYLALRGKDER